MKLEVGMYIRTEEFGIFQLLKLSEKYCDKPLGEEDILQLDLFATRDKHYTFRYTKGNENGLGIKASHNIIDLIEVGDYVNGEKVNGKYKNITRNSDYITIGEFDCDFYNEDIKSIVTKEQFEGVEYKL